MKIKKSKTPAQRQADLLLATEALARQWVNHWIDCGDMMTADMKDNAGIRVRTFQDFLIRDINTFARTGKYPQYADEEPSVVTRSVEDVDPWRPEDTGVPVCDWQQAVEDGDTRSGYWDYVVSIRDSSPVLSAIDANAQGVTPQ